MDTKVKMAKSSQKLFVVMLVLVLVLGLLVSSTNARRLAMARQEVEPTMMHSIESKWSSIGDNRVNFGMLPKGDIIPPSGPSTRTSDEPPPPPPLSLPLTPPPPSPLDYQMLPEGAGDARRLAMAGEEVVAAMMRLVEGKWSPSKDKRVRFGMLPKNKGLPSSGPLKGINKYVPMVERFHLGISAHV